MKKINVTFYFSLYISINKNFLVGDSSGELKLFSAHDGKFRTKLFSHSSDVSAIELDEK